MRRKFERFCYRHRNFGIPNLMLYVVLGSAVVYVLSLLDQSQTLYRVLCFDRSLILQGQVWRLFSYIFTYSASRSNILLVVLSLYCFYSLGRNIEGSWGTFRFNLFYFTGILLMDAFAMILGGIPGTVTVDGITVSLPGFANSLYENMVYYLNLSLLISFATLYPDARFLMFYILPVKAWIFGLIYLALTLLPVLELTFFLPDGYSAFPHNLFPLVALANYFLFFGKDVLNLFPQGFRNWFRRLFHKKPKVKPAPKQGPIPFRPTQTARPAPKREDFNHRCVICGRTDVSHPELEFRYCSRCQGYHCYCEDHINNHEHVQ